MAYAYVEFTPSLVQVAASECSAILLIQLAFGKVPDADETNDGRTVRNYFVNRKAAMEKSVVSL